MIFWKTLERTNEKQRDTLRAARDANETHRTAIDAGKRKRPRENEEFNKPAGATLTQDDA